jgi:exodeoxyribonuclease V gamma subunit
VARLVFSSRLAELAEALAGDVAAHRSSAGGSLLVPLSIAVSDRGVARYLALALARRHGIAVNLRFPFLGNLLAECLAPEARARLLDRRRLAARLASALGDPDILAGPGMATVRRYLEATDPGRSRAELALELARLFVDYSLTRPGWADDPEAFGDQVDVALEPWQRTLFAAASRPVRSVPAGALPLAPLPELMASVPDDQLQPPPALFAVGLEGFAAGDRLALERLARRCPIYLYAFNPCAEFWEDAGPRADIDAEDCLPLASWGRAGRAPVRQLTELADFDFEARFPTRSADTALGRLQADIAARRAAAERVPLAGDRSVEIVACPSVRRELEAIAESIWATIRGVPDAHFTDVAVLLAGADRDLYRAQIGAVFTELGNIPHHVLGVPLLEDSRVAEAIAWLLALPGSGFTRPAMMRVLTHPRVGGDGESGERAAEWLHWIERLGIFFGAGAEDHRRTYLPGDVFHWDQGILRLALGSCMQPDPDERPVTAGGRTALPLPIAGDHRPSAGRLALLTRSLIADCRWLAGRRLPLEEWGQVLGRFAAGYVEPENDRERLELGRCREAISGIGEPGDAPVPFAVARELAAAALAGLRTRRGEPLLDGVMVAPLGPAALIERRFLYIAGLGEQSFPASGGDSPLDLRNRGRRAGEPTERDRDRYGFLRAVLAAGDRLTLSYVGRDPHTGERLAASSVLAELAHAVAPIAEIEIEPFAHEDDGVEERGVHLAARRRRRAAALAANAPVRPHASRRRALEDLRDRLGDGDAARLLGLAANGIETDPSPKAHLSRGPLVGESQVRNLGPRDLSSTALAHFLESPVDAWVSHRLGLRDEAPPDVSADTEPLDLDALAETIIARGAVCELAIAGGDLEGAIAGRVQRMVRRGDGPAGVIADFHGRRAAELARAWWAGLQLAGVPEQARALAVGRAHEAAAVDELIEPLWIENAVEIHGAFPLTGSGGRELVYFDRSRKLGRRRILRGLVDHLILAAAGRCEEGPASILIVGAGEQRRLTIDSLDRDAALGHLALLAGELLDEVHDYLLPGEAVLEARDKGEPLAAALARRAGDRPPLWAPRDWRERGDFDVHGDAEAVVARRLDPLLVRIRGVA